MRRSGNLPRKTRQQHNTKADAKQCFGICLTIVDRLIHEDIWKEWVLQGEDSSSRYCARLFIQAKNPEKIESEWVRKHLISKTFRPTWNSPEVIRAMLATADAALKYSSDSHCERLIFCTEYCIPIVSLQQAGELAFKQDKSWLNARHDYTNNWENIHCFSAVKSSMIPPKVNSAVFIEHESILFFIIRPYGKVFLVGSCSLEGMQQKLLLW